MSWSIGTIPSQKGRLVVITGANSGLGYETAKFFASKEAIVIMACRNLQKGEEARETIVDEYPKADLRVMLIDLGDLSSIQSFANTYNDKYDRLDILFNNAGLMAIPKTITKDGFEAQFGVNHLGHFALTGRLLKTILATKNSRIVTLTSVFHYIGKINLEDPMSENRRYSKWGGYTQSKLANLLFTFELQRKLINHSTIAVAAHPGYATTHLQTRGTEMEKRGIRKKLVQLINLIIGVSANSGSYPQIRAATDIDCKGGDYYGPGLFNYLFPRRPRKVWSTARANDSEMAKKLWELSEELTGVQYKLK